MSLAAGAKWYRGQRLSAVWDILSMLQMPVAHEQWQTIGGGATMGHGEYLCHDGRADRSPGDEILRSVRARRRVVLIATLNVCAQSVITRHVTVMHNK